MTEADLLRDDEAARAAALAAEAAIVEAPAGAGKTELLSQRFLRLLARVEAPEEIVAVTFTNKAAAEMRQRIVDTLRAAALGEPPAAPHKRISFILAQRALAAGRERGWDLLAHPGRLRITTIDALCASLARQMPLLSRFGGEPRLAQDAGRHYEAAARRALAWLEAGDAPETAAAVEAALRHLDNDGGRLVRLLSAMLSRRDQWLRQALGAPARREAEEALAAL